MENMVNAIDDARIEEPLRNNLREFVERSSAYLINSGEPDHAAAEESSDPPGDAIRHEIAQRWEAQRTLDEAVAAVREGKSDHAIAAAETLQHNRSVFPGLLALMMGSRNPAMLQYVQETLTHQPALLRERYAGRTLLHEASAQGNLTMVELLLRLGADPNAQDVGSHTPLYCLAIESRTLGGGDIVRVLARSGAHINAAGGVKHSSALHMAARRGNLEIAAALLDCGADIDRPDSLGDTPLRRAVNCGRIQVASLLLARGADAHAKGSKGVTPLLAARTAAMKQLLRSHVDGKASPGARRSFAATRKET